MKGQYIPHGLILHILKRIFRFNLTYRFNSCALVSLPFALKKQVFECRAFLCLKLFLDFFYLLNTLPMFMVNTV